ncbi:hypothetical protein [Clostridium sp.]|uniref:hypothetical protein n=1 Tax=Clostridium sp. TaxID=1506 RepID=UPI003216C43B
MKARPKYNRTSKKWNIVVNYKGDEILLGKADGSFVKYTEFDTKQSTIDYINGEERLQLAKNLKEMIL